MSATATTAKSSDAPLQQETKQRKTLVSKILKRSSSMQTPTNDPKQQTNTGTATVTFNIKNDTISTEEAGIAVEKLHFKINETFQVTKNHASKQQRRRSQCFLNYTN